MLIGQGLAQRDLCFPGQRMADRHRQQQAVGTEVQYLQPFGLHRARDDAHVGAAVQHATHDVAAQPFLQVHRDAGALGEKSGQHLREEFGYGRGIGEDADVTGRVGAVFGELAFQIVHLAHDQPRMLQQLVPGRRQLHPAAVAVEQAAVELGFQRLDACTGGCR